MSAGSLAVDCAVSNEAKGGLKLITEIGISLPEEAVIEYPDGTQRRCRIRWQRLNEVGVSFLD
ncbi:hypothetical protein GV68_19750 [Pseudorhizobium pelagicum]|uniref:PilZ domain-containing protein n=1 Tax=Pseudorhizobium pelagicum TaxID=1509405 RepID=A0A922T4Z9_9HYPH|nr:hypothetical protein GV68_19750 [Pseudorhizobium pelagicum]